MNKFVRLSVIAGLLLSGASLVNTSYANDSAPVTIDQLKQLTQEPQDATVSERVTARFTRSHYRQFDLNADFSAKIFDRYLNMLDYGHNVLMASDIAQFADKRSTLGEELKTGQLNTPYALFNLAQKRRFERYTYALEVLARPMNFTGNDTINLDRAKAPWPKDKAELDSLWDAKVKYDELNLKLTGKTDQEIRDVLTKRYRFAMKRLTQSNSEDVFQLVMNAFAHEIDPHTNYLSPRINRAMRCALQHWN
jgi:carboxyl-terminal processing protease